MPELTVVVPAYRVRENIPALLAALERSLEGRDWETIIVVDDALDGTDEIVRERAQQDRRVRCIHRVGRRGLASACVEGLLASSATYLAVIDGDLPHDERLIPQMLDAIMEGGADIVVASRYMEGVGIVELLPARVRISRVASVLGQALAGGLSDPMSGCFVVRRAYLDKVVRHLYGRGFKILLDLVAAARGSVRIREIPYRTRSRPHRESRFSACVIAEFVMLILCHLSGRLIPVRFFAFSAVGLVGVGVHVTVLWSAFPAMGANFILSQSLAAWVAMTSTFFLNNAFTYGDQRLRGRRMWRGLIAFYVACGMGAVINLAISDWLYLMSVSYWIAGLAGAVIAAVWNYLTTASVTWGWASEEKS